MSSSSKTSPLELSKGLLTLARKGITPPPVGLSLLGPKKNEERWFAASGFPTCVPNLLNLLLPPDESNLPPVSTSSPTDRVVPLVK